MIAVLVCESAERNGTDGCVRLDLTVDASTALDLLEGSDACTGTRTAGSLEPVERELDRLASKGVPS
jgi:hypothetical protein